MGFTEDNELVKQPYNASSKKEPETLINTVLCFWEDYGIHLEQTEDGFLRCPKHDRVTGLCSVYEKRPGICKVFKCWERAGYKVR